MTLISDGFSGNTLSIGKRSSDKFIRVYEKQNSENTITIRTELELKGAQSKLVFDNLVPNDENRTGQLATLLSQSIETIAATPLLENTINELRAYQTTGQFANKRAVKSPETALEWFCKTCINIYEKYLENPNTRIKMLAIADELAIIAARYKKQKQGRISSVEKAAREAACEEIRRLLN